MIQRFLDPAVLAGISSLDLVAKTVVDGFISGLHRSPDFGFSQEFAEYKAYNPGDDLRHVDWNVYARTERMYLKRYRGETNCQVTILLDASRRPCRLQRHRVGESASADREVWHEADESFFLDIGRSRSRRWSRCCHCRGVVFGFRCRWWCRRLRCCRSSQHWWHP